MHGAILMAKMTFAGTLSTPMAAPDMSSYSCMSIAWHLLSATILIETIREKGMTQSLPFLKKNEYLLMSLGQAMVRIPADCCTLGNACIAGAPHAKQA